MLAAAACGGSPGGADDQPPTDAGTPTYTVCASGGAFSSLAEAVAAAPTGSTLALCAGTYPERVVIEGKTLALRGAGVDATIIDAGGAGTAVTIRAGAVVALSGLTVTGGAAAAGVPGGGVACDHALVDVRDAAIRASRASAGGGLYAAYCDVRIERTHFAGSEGGALGGGALVAASTGTVADSTFTGNSAEEGGGLAIADGTIAVTGNRFEGNTARVRGGGLHVSADATIDGNTLTGNHSGWTAGGLYVWMHAPVVRNNTIDGNDAVEEGGGAYFHESRATITDNVVTNNTAMDDGGGIRLFTCQATVERNQIRGNHAMGDGGGMKMSHLANQLADNQITDNVSDGAGGGLELDNDASVVRGGVIANNTARFGGGGVHIGLWPWAGGTLDGVRITGNRAGSGGGLYLENNYQPVTLTRLTIEDNHASRGGGLYARSTTFALTNSIVRANVASGEGGGFYLRTSTWNRECPCPPAAPSMQLAFVVADGNQAAVGPGLWVSQPGLTVTSSIFTGNPIAVIDGAVPAWRFNDTAPAGFTGMADPTGRDGNLAVPPGFADAAAGDFHLQPTSPCVDAGDPAMRDRDGSRADMGLYAGPTAP